MTDEQAGKFAQDSFLDYSINAAGIQALRKTALVVHRLCATGQS